MGKRPTRGPRSSSDLWFPVYLDLIHSGLWAKLSKSANALYPAICAFADFESGECFPSWTKLCERSGLSRKGLRDALADLEKAGLIQRYSGRKGRSNLYKLIRPSSFLGKPPQSPEETTPGFPEKPTPVSQVNSNNSQITNIHVTTTTTKSRRRGGRPSTSSESGPFDQLRGILGMPANATDDLEALVEEHSLERVEKAVKEAVSHRHPTLAYTKGVLRNWEREGRFTTDTKAETNRCKASDAKAEAARRRAHEAAYYEQLNKLWEELNAMFSKLDPAEQKGIEDEASANLEQQGIKSSWHTFAMPRERLKVLAKRRGIDLPSKPAEDASLLGLEIPDRGTIK